jgi:hypothetical protein
MVQSARIPRLELSWHRCGRDSHWCSFLGLDLASESLAKGGVYVIWSEDATGGRKRAVYVGQGRPIANCLDRHRGEPKITRHQREGRILRVTWAKVRKELRGGVERYLADALEPLEGARWSDDDQVPVNLPW